MMWEYWSIVVGLLVFLGLFLVCMEMLYARARQGINGKRAAPAAAASAGPEGKGMHTAW